jgi:hypothetical protein
MLPETKATLNKMKFVINHPERFHDWVSAFLAIFAKICLIFMLEVTMGIIICGQCEVILTVILYLGLLGLQEVDTYCFLSFPDSMPFKKLVDADKNELPEIFNIDKTSSMKNNFADKGYSEGLKLART